MIHLPRLSELFKLFLLIACLGVVACGEYASTLTDADRALYERFVEVDVATLDDEDFADLIALRKELTSGNAAMNMSGEETEKATAQIEAMIARLESEVAATTDKKVQKSKGRELYDLKKAIGRGGA